MTISKKSRYDRSYRWGIRLADEAVAGEFDAFEAAEEGDGDEFGAEELLGHLGDLVAGDLFDLLKDFVEAGELVEVHLLAGEVGHARGGAFEREQEVALELVLGSA